MNDLVTKSIPYVYNITILLLTFDAAHWACTLIRHSVWLGKHPQREDIDCDKITHRMLFTAAMLSGFHLLIVNLAWVYLKVFYGYHLELFVLIAGVDIMAIHLYALIARCTNLDRIYWPYLSIVVADMIISPCRLFIIAHRQNTNFSSEEKQHNVQ